MCQLLRVSRSGYYYWLQHPVGLSVAREQQILVSIRKVYQQRNCRYDSLRRTVDLREQGIAVSRPCVARLMRKHGIRRIIRVQTTDSNHGHA